MYLSMKNTSCGPEKNGPLRYPCPNPQKLWISILHGKRDLAGMIIGKDLIDVIKLKDLEVGRLLQIIWVGPKQ